MNYEEMSDNEINEKVADLMGGYVGNVYGSETAVMVSDRATGGLFYMDVDYCNNPLDAWPIIMSNFISIDQHYNGSYMRVWGYCDSGEVSLQCLHKDALRTAMIVFLNMSDTTCQKK